MAGLNSVSFAGTGTKFFRRDSTPIEQQLYHESIVSIILDMLNQQRGTNIW